MLIALGLCLACIGATLVARGIVGGRRGDEPRCRRCEFDLSRGNPISMRCPECGADLARGHARVRGRRHRLWWRATIGAVLGLAGGSLTVHAWHGASWTSMAPAWWLARVEYPPGKCVEADRDLDRTRLAHRRWSCGPFGGAAGRRAGAPRAGTVDDRRARAVRRLETDLLGYRVRRCADPGAHGQGRPHGARARTVRRALHRLHRDRRTSDASGRRPPEIDRDTNARGTAPGSVQRTSINRNLAHDARHLGGCGLDWRRAPRRNLRNTRSAPRRIGRARPERMGDGTSTWSSSHDI